MFSVESGGGGEEDIQGLRWILIFGDWQSDLTRKGWKDCGAVLRLPLRLENMSSEC